MPSAKTIGQSLPRVDGGERDATGHRFTELPITAQAVRQALGETSHT